MAARFVLAQISDLHVTATPRPEFDSAANVKRALDAVRAYEPDIILATGDLADDACAEEYEALAPLLADPPAPLYLIAGNHDEPAHIRKYFPGHAYLPKEGRLSYVIDGAVRVVALDQTVYGKTGGAFDNAGAAWLEAQLAAAPDKPTVVALHHPPFLTHDRLFDRIGLANHEAFAAVIARHPQVDLVIAGHHHRAIQGRVAHAPAVIAPSTAYTYELSLQDAQEIGRKNYASYGFALHVWPESGPPTSHFIYL